MVWLFSILFFVIILSAYVASAHFAVGNDVPGNASQASRRDGLYFAIHGGTLLLALILGFLLGKWLNGLGVAFAALSFVVVASFLALGQVAAFQAACHGQNDIIRHWTC